jgi:hypothetical protein
VTNKAKKLLVMQKFKNNHLKERPNVIVRYKVDEWSTPSNTYMWSHQISVRFGKAVSEKKIFRKRPI